MEALECREPLSERELMMLARRFDERCVAATIVL
jgi:hypothetical protein